MKLKPHITQAYRPDQIPDIARFVEQNVFPGANDVPADGIRKTAQVHILQWGKVKTFLDWSQQWLRYWNSREIGLAIYDMQDLDLVNYNVYDSSRQGEYAWHVDGFAGPADIKLTAVVNISTEPFEGGDLELFVDGGPRILEEMRTPGALVVFPSIVPHRVTPVTRGIRRTISYWVLGPNFR